MIVDDVGPPVDPGPMTDSSNSSDSRLNEPTPTVPRRAYVAIAILFFVNLLNYMDRFTIAGVLTDIQAFYGIDDTGAGFLQTVFICSYMVFAPIFGFLGDRYNRKHIMSAGIALWSAAVLASSFVPAGHTYAFFLCRALVGIGEASYSTVSPTIIADLFHKDLRSRMLMLFYFAIPVGSGLGFVVGANVAHLAGSWEWGVRTTPILGAVALGLILFVLEEPARGQSDHAAAVRPTSWLQDVCHLTRNRTYIWTTLGFTCVAFVAGCLSWWTPNFVIYAVEKSGRIPHKAAINLKFGVITCISGFVGVATGAFWAERWRRTNPRADPLVCAIGLVSACPFLFAGLNLVELSMAGTWALMFFAVTLVSLNWSIVSDILLYIVTPGRRATASAFQILFSHLLGDAFSPLLVGKVSDVLCGDGAECDVARHFHSLKYALFIPTFVLVLGGLAFVIAAGFVQGDRRRATYAARGLEAEPQVAATQQSREPVIPYSDSTAPLVPDRNAVA